MKRAVKIQTETLPRAVLGDQATDPIPAMAVATSRIVDAGYSARESEPSGMPEVYGANDEAAN
jgi:hypothetical protein